MSLRVKRLPWTNDNAVLGDPVQTMLKLFAVGLSLALALVACSTENPQAEPASGGSPDGGAGTTGSDDGDDGDEPEDKGAAIPAVAIPATPAADCPATYDGPGRGPVAGTNSNFEAGGQSRRFQLLLPPPSFTGPRPILFAFHGTTETGTKFITRAKLADFVARGFVVVAPDAAGNGFVWPVWDAMRPNGTEAAPNADLALFDRLLSCTSAHYAIDKNRVFATGHSAGGIFTNRLLRSRSSVLAGGIVASGLLDFTGPIPRAPLDSTLAIVTWGGENDTYSGTTPGGVSVPAISFVEQASLASRFYDAEPAVQHVRCRGNNLGHAWLPLNGWFIDLLLSHPKGVAASPSFVLPPPPAGSPAVCSTDPYTMPPLPDMTCPATARAGCTSACQLFADCAVENRTLGPTIAGALSKIGFTTSSCSGCVQRCQVGATTATDADVLACFKQNQLTTTCGPGLEGAKPLFGIINSCCNGKTGSTLCKELCTALNASSSAATFLPTCQQF